MHTLDALVGIVDEVIIIIGFRGSQIRMKIGDRYKKMRIRYVEQTELLGTGHAPLLARELIEGRFMVINGDDLFSHIDLKAVSEHDYCLLAQERDDAHRFGVVVAEGDVVKGIVEKPNIPPTNLVNVGVYCFKPDVFAILENLELSPRGEYEITDAIEILARRGLMRVERVQGDWIPVGYPWHILEATKKLCNGQGDTGNNLLVGEDCRIGEGVVFEGTVVLGDNCIVEDGVTIRDSVVFSNSLIGQGAHIERSVVGEGAQVKRGVFIGNTNQEGTVVVTSREKKFDSGKECLGAFIGCGCIVERDVGSGECFLK